MSDQLKVSICFVSISVLFLGIYNSWQASLSVLCSSIVFVAIAFFEKRKSDELSELKKDVQDLKNKIESIQISRALHR